MKRVLVIDDSEFTLKTMQRSLHRHFDVITANSGADGIAKAKSEKPDMILLDMMMPGMDGIQVCNHLTADEETKDIPIIFVTSVDNRLIETKCLEMGARDYIEKPIMIELMIQRIENVLKFSERSQ
jgi:CheY-like chemotaxis protein